MKPMKPKTPQEIRERKALLEAFVRGRVYEIGLQKKRPWIAEETAENIAITRALRILHPKRKPS